MAILHAAFFVLIGITPLLAFADSISVSGLTAIYVATLLGCTAFMSGPVTIAHTFKTMRIPLGLAAVPLLCFLLQLLPMSAGGVSRSLWENAASTLGTTLWPHFTIDPGLTVLATFRYLTVTAAVTLAAVLATDREVAEFSMLISGAATTMMSLMLLIQTITGFQIPGWDGPQGAGAVFTVASALGVVIWASIAVMIIERFTVHRKPLDTWSTLILPLGATIGLAAISGGAALLGDRHAAFAALCGLFLLASVFVLRRIGLGFKSALIVCAVGLLAIITITWRDAGPPGMGVAQRYAGQAPAALKSAANRMSTEVGPVGSGAGTFSAVFPLYGTVDDPNATVSAPTFASQIAIEMGRTAMGGFALLAGILIVLCIRGAFNRGRDFFYPAAGAATGVVGLLTAFFSAALANSATALFLAVVIGVGLSQSAGRNA